MYHYKIGASDINEWTIAERNRRVASLNKQIDAEKDAVKGNKPSPPKAFVPRKGELY